MDVEIGNGAARLLLGDCLERLRGLPDCSVDAVVTDPPYGLSDHSLADTMSCLQAWLAGEEYRPKKRGFMGRSWDAWVPGPEVWREVLRVLKPGGHLLAFAGTRSMDLMSMAVRLAGFELRDAVGYANDGGDPLQAPLLAWSYAQGFPKSMDVSKAIDKAAGIEGTFGAPKSAAHAGWIERGRMRGEEGHDGYQRPWMADSEAVDKNARQYIGGTDAARQWQGFGTALKPAWEPIILARKPLIGTVAENVLAHGTGAISINSCRVLPGTKGKLVSHARYIVSCVACEFDGSKFGTSLSPSDPDFLRMLGKQLLDGGTLLLSASHESVRDGIDQSLQDFPGGYQAYLHFCGALVRLEEGLDQSSARPQGYAHTRNRHSMLSDGLAGESFDNLLCECTNLLSMLDFSRQSDPDFRMGIELLRRAVSKYSESFRSSTKALWQGWWSSLLPNTVARFLVPDPEKISLESDKRGFCSPFEMLLFNINAVPYVTTNTFSFVIDAIEETGRWPANLITDGSPEVVAHFPDSLGAGGSVPNVKVTGYGGGIGTGSSEYLGGERTKVDSGTGSAARFFYQAKVGKRERNEGLPVGVTNNHPCLKPVDLLAYLCRLVTPPGGGVLDPFMGSGSTGKAAIREGFRFIGCELSQEYLEIARARIEYEWQQANPEPAPADDVAQLSLFA